MTSLYCGMRLCACATMLFYWPLVTLRVKFADDLVSFGAWCSVEVKALRYKSMGPGIDPRWFYWGFFPGASTVPCALGSTQPLKMSTRIFLVEKAVGAKGWRPYNLHSAECRDDSGALTCWNPTKTLRLVTGNLYLFFSCIICRQVRIVVMFAIRS
jgi:hypothetical protein